MKIVIAIALLLPSIALTQTELEPEATASKNALTELPPEIEALGFDLTRSYVPAGHGEFSGKQSWDLLLPMPVTNHYAPVMFEGGKIIALGHFTEARRWREGVLDKVSFKTSFNDVILCTIDSAATKMSCKEVTDSDAKSLDGTWVANAGLGQWMARYKKAYSKHALVAGNYNKERQVLPIFEKSSGKLYRELPARVPYELNVKIVEGRFWVMDDWINQDLFKKYGASYKKDYKVVIDLYNLLTPSAYDEADECGEYSVRLPHAELAAYSEVKFLPADEFSERSVQRFLDNQFSEPRHLEIEQFGRTQEGLEEIYSVSKKSSILLDPEHPENLEQIHPGESWYRICRIQLRDVSDKQFTYELVSHEFNGEVARWRLVFDKKEKNYTPTRLEILREGKKQGEEQ